MSLIDFGDINQWDFSKTLSHRAMKRGTHMKVHPGLGSRSFTQYNPFYPFHDE